jgi:hypothetical protein
VKPSPDVPSGDEIADTVWLDNVEAVVELAWCVIPSPDVPSGDGIPEGSSGGQPGTALVLQQATRRSRTKRCMLLYVFECLRMILDFIRNITGCAS